ncbi:hypothetical protein MTR67_046885 [Solanum verrucosum]|uniref:EF-hand domain-containing protein n=1 Tax=Solanum verrucosum TaxID=315347 RepID=A0AAF0UVF9_SOLVR|nr:hypothetical protein MTR67_046885 [Solanum verrucosum]
MTHMNRMEREDCLYKAFEYFDKNKNGYITMEELEHALKEYNITDEKTIKEIIIEVDTGIVRYPFLYARLYDISIYNI